MPLKIDLQLVMSDNSIPDRAKFQNWVDAAADACHCDNMALTIRVTDAAESAELNARYRNKPEPTNVLSFPYEDPPGMETNVLGDLVVCAPVVQNEAVEQHKSSDAHWAHMLVHGVLHLCGYDHTDQPGTDEMESLETSIITALGFPPPYNEQKL